MPITANVIRGLTGGIDANSIAFGTLTNARLPSTIGTVSTQFVGNGSQLTGVAPALSIANVQITDSSWVVLDDIAVSTSGGYCLVNGTGFAPGSMVTVGTDFATAVSYMSSTQLRTQVSAKTAGSYNVTVIRGDTTVATLALGITYSAFPVWSTSTDLGNVTQNITFTKTLAASSDSNVTYSNTTALPPQTTLTSNGTFSGNITSVADDTLYTFGVKATDLEYQDVSRTFSLQYFLAFAIGDLSAVTFSMGHRSFVIAGKRAYAFGWNDSGSLGTGNTTDRYTPTNIMSIGSLSGKRVSKVASGASHTIILCTDGTLHTFGYNYYGQLGFSTNYNTGTANSTPTNITSNGSLSGRTASEISCGSGHTMVVCTDGTLHAFGYNGDGQLGNGNTSSTYTPTNVSSNGSLSGKTISKVVCGGYHTLVLCTDNTLHAFGQNGYGQLGIPGNTSNQSTQQNISSSGSLSGKTVSKISAGDYFSMVLCTDGTLHSFGYNTFGQLGFSTNFGSANANSTPINISSNGSLSGKTVSKISCGRDHMLVLCSDGTLHAFGVGGNGQLGFSVGGNMTYTPTNISSNGSLSGKTVDSIAGGASHSLVLCTDKTLHSFGYNYWGQLGSSTNLGSSVFTPINITSAIVE